MFAVGGIVANTFEDVGFVCSFGFGFLLLGGGFLVGFPYFGRFPEWKDRLIFLG